MLAASPAALRPDDDPGERAVLRLGSPPGGKPSPLPVAEFEVGVRRTVDGPSVTLSLLSDGEVLERETYESRADAFRATSVGDDGFDPPLELLRYPVRDGAAWGWRGNVVYGGVSRNARAQVTVAHDGDEVRSDVAILFSAEDVKPELKRSLTFWFRKGRGVVRRAFGDSSSRRPAGEAWRP